MKLSSEICSGTKGLVIGCGDVEETQVEVATLTICVAVDRSAVAIKGSAWGLEIRWVVALRDRCDRRMT